MMYLVAEPLWRQFRYLIDHRSANDIVGVSQGWLHVQPSFRNSWSRDRWVELTNAIPVD